MLSFEQDNLKAYSLLLRIEIALRECLKESLQSEFGNLWQKRLPGDLLSKIKKSQNEEDRPQFDFVRLGPLYYLTFGELIPILKQKIGRPVADKLGGDSFIKQLESILVPRNAICHSRPVSSIGLKTIETLYRQLQQALTAEKLAILLAQPDVGLSQESFAKTLKPFLQQVLLELDNFPSAFELPDSYLNATVQFWWADDSLAGFNLRSVDSAVQIIVEYGKLPTGLCSLWNRQKFCKSQNMRTRIQDAISELQKVQL